MKIQSFADAALLIAKFGVESAIVGYEALDSMTESVISACPGSVYSPSRKIIKMPGGVIIHVIPKPSSQRWRGIDVGVIWAEAGSHSAMAMNSFKMALRLEPGLILETPPRVLDGLSDEDIESALPQVPGSASPNSRRAVFELYDMDIAFELSTGTVHVRPKGDQPFRSQEKTRKILSEMMNRDSFIPVNQEGAAMIADALRAGWRQ